MLLELTRLSCLYTTLRSKASSSCHLAKSGCKGELKPTFIYPRVQKQRKCQNELLSYSLITQPLRLRFFLTLRLLCLTVLVLGALLSSFLEEALYKCSI